jgi:hypothetical protein
VVRIDRGQTEYSLPAVAEITDPESLLSLGASSSTSEVLLHDSLRRPWFEPSSLESPSRPKAPQADVTIKVPEGAAAPDPAPESDSESPASSVRPAQGGVSVRLSDNETLARISNAGIVIRRRKKA